MIRTTITQALGADKLQEKRRIRPTRIFLRKNPDGTTTERLDCFRYPAAGKYESIMLRSANNEVYVMTVAKDEDNSVVNLQ